MGRAWLKTWVAVATAMIAVEAHAGGIVIDQATYLSFTPCSYTSAPCTNFFSTTSEANSWTEVTNTSTKTINFTLNFGTGDQTRIYAYDNGLFSVGATLPGTVQNAGSFADFGSNVFSPLYYAAGLTTSDYQYAYGTLDNLNGALTGRQYLRIRYNAVYGGVTFKVEAQLVEETAAGDFLLSYGYGQSGYPANVPDNALIGFQLGANAENKRAVDYQAELGGTGGADPFYYRFVNAEASPAVPEPATWAMMIVGFGAIGASLRRRSMRAGFTPA